MKMVDERNGDGRLTFTMNHQPLTMLLPARGIWEGGW